MDLVCSKLGYPENKRSRVPHLPPIQRPVVPNTANVPTAKGVLNSNFRCGVNLLRLCKALDTEKVTL